MDVSVTIVKLEPVRPCFAHLPAVTVSFATPRT
jgi:hypothetical protein